MPKSRKQKLYKMRGCSEKNKSRKHLGTKKMGGKYLGGKYLGGSNTNLAYTGKPIFSLPNPHLAYTGPKKGGSGMRINTNAENPVYPNTGGPPASQNWLNSSMLKGGSCGGTCGLLKGGSNHRSGCKCSKCKGQKGGNGLPYGQGLPEMNPILAPNGLTGSNWGADFKWPGTTNIGGNNNHYALNTYAPVDISRQMQNIGAQPPFLGGGKRKRKGKSRKQRAGGLSNFLYQDFVNVGRQFQHGLGSTYNALSGYSAPVNPMPWQQPGLSNPR